MEHNALIERVLTQLRAVDTLSSLPLTYDTGYQPPEMMIAPSQIAGLIDHTLLKPEATPQQIAQLCHEARHYQFASVCVNPCYAAHCAHLLEGSGVVVCSVVGFPLGAATTETKLFEARQLCRIGVSEVDMVMAIGMLKGGAYAEVVQDIQQVVAACHAEGAICKVIIETALLNDEEKVAACLLAAAVQADFVKTSTGFAGGGATLHDVALMRRMVGAALGVKASGGIRTRADAEALIAAGATRIGTSAGVTIADTHSAEP